jgi:hypothetical protein
MRWSVAEPASVITVAVSADPGDGCSSAIRRMPAIERIPKLLEALVNLERDLTLELVEELGRCSTGDLATLFGSAPARADTLALYGPAPACGQVPTVDTSPAELLSAEGPAELAVEAPAMPVTTWDANGRRISPKGQSAFEPIARKSERPPPRGSHWSR